jgi:hypothetical protein
VKDIVAELFWFQFGFMVDDSDSIGAILLAFGDMQL